MNRSDAERLRDVHDQLAAAVGTLTDSPGWRRMLVVASRFPRYSPHNVLLIAAQRPEATRVAGYRTWRQLGRQVRKGERGIAILAPVTARRDGGLAAPEPAETDERAPRLLRGFRVTHVFDIAQTEGPPLPEVRPRLLTGDADPGLFAALAAQLHAAGYRVERQPPDTPAANGEVSFTDRVVRVRPELPAAQAVKTLAHELGHVLLHAPGADATPVPRRVAEVEAESVAFLVTGAHGIDAGGYTVPYVAGWAGGRPDVVLASAERVLGAAGRILAAAAPPDDDRPAAVVTPARAADRPVAEPVSRAVVSRASGRLPEVWR